MKYRPQLKIFGPKIDVSKCQKLIPRHFAASYPDVKDF